MKGGFIVGLKRLKKEFNIGHTVLRDGGEICIGSAYVHNLITITGKHIKSSSIVNANSELGVLKHQLSEAALTGKLQEIIDCQDEYTASLPVYSLDRGRVVRQYCEEYGWPNVTHGGELMYDNTCFKTRKEALKFARKEVHACVWNRAGNLKENLKSIFKKIKRLAIGICYWLRVYVLRGY